MPAFTGKNIVLGVTGGIAAYKAVQIVSLFKKRGFSVRVVMTENARRFIDQITFETISANPVYVDTFARRENMAHISLAKWADAFVVAPATANFIGKYACGIADDLLSTTAMVMTCPVFLAPAMNNNMWKSAAVRKNVETLFARAAQLIGPESGSLACGDDDVGRMSEPETIVSFVEKHLSRALDFAGKRVLVTAGPTVEMIDPVRFITNRSTGKMGYAVAEAAKNRGADVTLISGPVSINAPAGVLKVDIKSAEDLKNAVLSRADWAEIVIQAAAPADFRPEKVSDQKIKKTGGGMTLALESTTDIAFELGKIKRAGQVLVAFAAETQDLLENARKKLDRKNADMIVANDVTLEGAGFGTDTNIITLIARDFAREIPKCQKLDAADAILDGVLEILSCATHKS